MEMDTTQIKGVDSTKRLTEAKLGDGADADRAREADDARDAVCGDGVQGGAGRRGLQHGRGEPERRPDESKQLFVSCINGNGKCSGHSECDAIIGDSASVRAGAEITANSVEASLIHEAAIGKIAGEQLIKLMTLGLTEEEAEEQIVAGFLKQAL